MSVSPSRTTVCNEVFDDNSLPSEEEIKEYALKIGIDPTTEPQLLHFARDGLMQALPPDWKPCYDKKINGWYYFNFRTGESRWEHPLDDVYRMLVKKGRSESVSSAGEDDSKTSLKEDLKSYEEAVTSDMLSRSADSFKPGHRKGNIVQLAPLRRSPSRLEPSMSPLAAISPTKMEKKDVFISPDHADQKQPPLAKKVDLIKTESRSTPASPTRIELSGGADTWDVPSPASMRIDIDKMDFGSVSSRQDSARKERLLSAQEKHPRSMHGRSELTLSGGGSMFLKSSKPKAESPVSPSAGGDSEPIVAVVSLTSRDDPLPKSILRDQRSTPPAKPLWDLDPREMSFEEKQLWRRQELEEERKSVRFNLEKELDIHFNISDSEDANEEGAEEEDVEDEIEEEEEILEREEDWNSEEEDPEEERLIAGIKVSDILNLMDASELDEVSAKEDAHLAILAEDVLETQMQRQSRLNGNVNVSALEITSTAPKSEELSTDVKLSDSPEAEIVVEEGSPEAVVAASTESAVKKKMVITDVDTLDDLDLHETVPETSPEQKFDVKTLQLEEAVLPVLLDLAAQQQEDTRIQQELNIKHSAEQQEERRKEQERMKKFQQDVEEQEAKRKDKEEAQRIRQEEIEAKRKEELQRIHREIDEKKAKQKEEEEKQRVQRDAEEAERKRDLQRIQQEGEEREAKRKEQEEIHRIMLETEAREARQKEKEEMQRMQQNSEVAIRTFRERLDRETEAAMQQLKVDYAQQLREMREQLASEEQTERTRLQGELEERMVQFEKELIDKQQRQEQSIRDDVERSLSELRDALAAERDARSEEQRNEFAQEREQLQAARAEMEAEGEAQRVRLQEEMEARQAQMLLQHQQDVEEAEARLQENLAERLPELEAAAYDKVMRQLEMELEARRHELLEEHRAALDVLQEQQALARDKIRLEYREEEDALRKDHVERLEEMRVRLEIERQRARDRELQEDERKREAARQEMVENSRVFEKLRCEKRLLEDKYRSLKEKYIRLKTDVKISIERRKRREGGTTTGSETERSTSHNKTARPPPDIDRSVVDSPRGRARKRTTENPDGGGTTTTAAASAPQPPPLSSTTANSTSSSKHQQSSAPISPPPLLPAAAPKNLPAQLPPEVRPAGVPLSPPGVDSDNVSSTSSKPRPKPAKHPEPADPHNNNNINGGSGNNNRRRRQLFGRLKSASTSRLIHNNITNNNNNNNNDGTEDGSVSCSPVENLRRQLKKLEDLEDQFPVATHTDTYLRYPFSDTGSGQFGSSELEFFRHRIHLERDSVRRAKDFLRVQRNSFQSRQRELKQRHVDGSTTARNMLDQLYQEERELTDMEVSLHRTRSLLGEKIIRLRHLEQSLHRVGDKGDVRAVEDATLSDLSSHSGSSGFSSTELGTDTPLGHSTLHRGTHYQESTEIIQSLENLNTEIREIWEVLNKQQKEGSVRTAIPPPPLVYTDMGWPTLTGARGSVVPSSVPERVQTFRPQNPPPPYVRSAATVEASLVERTRSLRDWLRQARLDSSDLGGPTQPTM